jgi:hypothetical protein
MFCQSKNSSIPDKNGWSLGIYWCTIYGRKLETAISKLNALMHLRVSITSWWVVINSNIILILFICNMLSWPRSHGTSIQSMPIVIIVVTLIFDSSGVFVMTCGMSMVFPMYSGCLKNQQQKIYILGCRPGLP